MSLFEAFAEAKNHYVADLRNDEIPQETAAVRTYRRVMDTVGQDPLPYGIAPNRPMLDTLVRYAVEQEILRRPVDVDDVFAANTRQLTS